MVAMYQHPPFLITIWELPALTHIYTIYRAYCKPTGKSYIGFDSNWPSRKNKHLKNCRLGLNNCPKFYSALKKYGPEAFQWEILYQSSFKHFTLDVMEEFCIQKYNSRENGYNIAKGGSAPMLGAKQSKETIEKRAKSHRGKKHTKETKAKIAAAHLGCNHTETSKIKMSLVKCKHTYHFLDPDGKEVKLNNLYGFCKENKLSNTGMANVYSGKNFHHKGWRKYREDLINVKFSPEEHYKAFIERKFKPCKIVNPFGEIIEISNRTDFCKKNGLSVTALSDVVAGKRNHHKNWTKYIENI